MSSNVRTARVAGPAWLAITATAILVLGCGGSTATGGPGGTSGPGATGGPAATSGGGGGGGEGTATLSIDSADIKGNWELRGGRSVTPTDTLASAIFTETVSDMELEQADLITITLSGTLEANTRPTSAAGITLSFGYSRADAAGTDIFLHVWSSTDGSCDVTMAPSATGWAGSFTCASITDPEGHTVSANGTFNT